MSSYYSWVTFSGCSALKTVIFGNNVTKIPANTFYGCNSITSVTIGTAVNAIGGYAFYNCSGLSEIINYATTPQVINANVFENVNKNTCTLYVPSASLTAYSTANVWKEFFNIVPISGGDKSVTVGYQNGTLTAGVSGSVTFSVTTENIANGAYTATVTNLPTGVTVSGNVAIYNNYGTLTLAGSTSTMAGTTSSLRLTIDGTQSNPFTLTISPAATKSVTVGYQNGTLTAGISGSVTFPVTTANIASGTYTVTVTNLPTGVTVSGNVAIYNNYGTLTLAGSTSTMAGTTNSLRLTIDGTQSNAFTLTVSGATSVTEQDNYPNLRVYPNPTQGELYVSTSDYQISDIRLFDVMGRQISIVGQSEIGQSETTINIAHLPTGVYFLKIQTENGVVVRKVVKK